MGDISKYKVHNTVPVYKSEEEKRKAQEELVKKLIRCMESFQEN